MICTEGAPEVVAKNDLRYLHKSDSYFPIAAPREPAQVLFRVAHEVWGRGSYYAVNRQEIITLLQVKAGKAAFRLNQSEGVAGKGDLLCYGLESAVSITVLEELELQILCLLPHALELTQACDAAPGRMRNLGAAAGPCWRTMKEILQCALTDNPLKERIANSLTRVWLDWCASSMPADQQPPAHNHLVAQACSYIHSHLEELRSLAQLAEACGCSREHLSRAFIAEFHEGPWLHIRRRQMELAAQILRHTTDSIESVAERFGYCDRYAFSRAFREFCGISPAKFRRVPHQAAVPARKRADEPPTAATGRKPPYR